MRCTKVTQQLSALLDGELQPSEAEQVRGHLESCPDCRKQLQALEATIQSVRELPAMRAPSDLASRVLADIEKPDTQPAQQAEVIRAHFSMRMLWPAAAALLIGVGIAVLSRSAQRARIKDFAPHRTERQVAMLDADSKAGRENVPVGEGIDDSYSFWAVPGDAPQSEKLPDTLRAMPSLTVPDKKMPELALARKGGPPGAAGKGAKEAEALNDSVNAERLDEDGAAPALALRMQAMEKELKEGASVADARKAPRTLQFEIHSEDPQAAYAKVAAISARFVRAERPLAYAAGGPAPQVTREEVSPKTLVLMVTNGQLAQIRKEIVGAGLVPTEPEKPRAEYAAYLRASEEAGGGFLVRAAEAKNRSIAEEDLQKTTGQARGSSVGTSAETGKLPSADGSRRVEAPRVAMSLDKENREADTVQAEAAKSSAEAKEQLTAIAGRLQTKKLPTDEKITDPERSLIEPPVSADEKVVDAEQKQSPLQSTRETLALEAAETKAAVAARRIDKTPEGALGKSAVARARGAEPLIRVSISFIKIDEKAAAAVEMPAADADIKDHSE